MKKNNTIKTSLHKTADSTVPIEIPLPDQIMLLHFLKVSTESLLKLFTFCTSDVCRTFVNEHSDCLPECLISKWKGGEPITLKDFLPHLKRYSSINKSPREKAFIDLIETTGKVLSDSNQIIEIFRDPDEEIVKASFQHANARLRKIFSNSFGFSPDEEFINILGNIADSDEESNI